jgi:hypothetical protein
MVRVSSCAHHFLSRLFEIDGFAPGCVDFDKPDFILSAGGKRIGLEVTRSVCQESMRALKVQAVKYPSSWIHLTNCVDDGARRSKACLEKSILSPFSKSRTVESLMLQWQRRLTRIYDAKWNKLNQNYRIFDENWLLISDVLPPLIDRQNYGFACHLLSGVFRKKSGLSKDFDAVFVNSRDLLFRWDDGILHCARFDDPVALVLA